MRHLLFLKYQDCDAVLVELDLVSVFRYGDVADGLTFHELVAWDGDLAGGAVCGEGSGDDGEAVAIGVSACDDVV